MFELIVTLSNHTLYQHQYPFVGREGGRWGIEEYMEIKYMGMGY